jgi:hypothetical protein
MPATEAIIDPFPISGLQDRYGIGQAQVYNRMNKLDIEPISRGKVSAEQVRLLDEYDKYLKEPKPEISNLTLEIRKQQQGVESTVTTESHTIEILSHLLEKIVLHRSQPSPLSRFEELEKAVNLEIILPTSAIAELIGCKPRGLGVLYGCYSIQRCKQKVGREAGWLVIKILPNLA